MIEDTEPTLEELICRSIVSIADHIGLSTYEIESIRTLLDEKRDLMPYLVQIFGNYN